MEQKFYTDNFEQLLKEKSDEFRMYPSKRVWHSIYNDLHPGRKWPSVAVSLLLISALFFMGYWNSSLSSTAVSKNIAAVADKNKAQKFSNENSNTGSKQKDDVTVTAGNHDIQNTSPYSNINQGGNIIGTPAQSHSGTAYSGLVVNNKANDAAAKYTNVNIARLNKTQVPVNDKTPIHNNSTAAFSAVISEGTTETGKDEAQIITEKNYTEVDKILPGTGNIENVAATTTTGITEKSTDAVKENKPVVLITAKSSSKNSVSTEEKAWIEDYAFHNKPLQNKWKGRIASEIYITPSIGYRKLTSNTDYAAPVAGSFPAATINNGNNNTSFMHKPSMGIEVGAGVVLAAAKNLRIKAGIQADYTSYSITATEMNHPILTTLLLNDINTGFTYLDPRSSSLANAVGYKTTKIHNQTYQLSLPVGFALKLAGNNKLEWYAGATIQPTYVFGGKANLISADHKNYVADASLIRSWNLNTGFETYLTYKMNGYTLQVGPQFRYQVISTYSKKYTYNENLYNTGLKIGLIRNF